VSTPDTPRGRRRYFFELNGHGIDTLWMQLRPNDSQPVPLLSRFDIPPEVRGEAWEFVRSAIAAFLNSPTGAAVGSVEQREDEQA